MYVNSFSYQTVQNNNENTIVEPDKQENEAVSVFTGFNDWVNGHESNTNFLINSYEDAIDLTNKANNLAQEINNDPSISPEKREEYAERLEEVYETADNIVEDAKETYAQNRETIGVEYSFMGEKDPEDEKEYNQQLEEFTSDEIELKDENDDGKLSKDEYVNWQLEHGADIDNPIELKIRTEAAFDKINNDYGSFQDKILTGVFKFFGKTYANPVRQSELNKFYQDLDTIGSDDEGNTYTAEKDGKINVGGTIYWAQTAYDDKKESTEE